MSTALAPRDAERLADLEVTIAQGLHTWVEVGTALLEIRASRLYRAEFPNFESYCQAKFGIDRTYAHRMIEAATVVGNLLPIGNTDTPLPAPSNEAQARPLAALAPEQQREAWAEANATAPQGKVTAEHVTETVKRLFVQPPMKPTPVIPFNRDKPRTIDEEASDLIREEEKSAFSVVMGFIDHPTDTPLTVDQIREFYADPHFAPVVLPRIERMHRNFELLRSLNPIRGGSHVSA
jgi:hypothetical protein